MRELEIFVVAVDVASAAGPVQTRGRRRPRARVREVTQIAVADDDAFLQRRALASLDDRALKDIGLSRSDIFVETTKPFWRR